MNDSEKLLLAYRYGHFWNPAKSDVRNVDRSSVEKLAVDHPIAQQAIQSWQEADANFGVLARLFHRREAVCDGLCGPATNALMEWPRCAMPDHAPPPNASFDYGHPGLNSAVLSYQTWAAHQAEAQATGSGSWPVGCDPNRKDVHSVVVGLDDSRASSTQKAMLDEVLRFVEETEAEIGQAVRHVRDGSFANPQHDVKFESIPGSVIGYAYFPTPNTCNQTVTARIDNGFNPGKFTLAELLTHEYKGHSDGLSHTNGGIMNPSIGSPTKRPSWVGDTSFSRKRAYFGGEPIPGPGPGPTPTNPPITGSIFAETFAAGIAIRGDLSLTLNNVTYRYVVAPDGVAGRYRVITKPNV